MNENKQVFFILCSYKQKEHKKVNIKERNEKWSEKQKLWGLVNFLLSKSNFEIESPETKISQGIVQ